MKSYSKTNKKILYLSIVMAGCPVISFASAYHYVQFKNNTNYPANITRTGYGCMYGAGPEIVKLLAGQTSDIYIIEDKNPGTGSCNNAAKYISYRFTNQDTPMGKAMNFSWGHSFGLFNGYYIGWGTYVRSNNSDGDYEPTIRALCGDGVGAKLDPEGNNCYGGGYLFNEYDKTLIIFGKETAPEMLVNNFRYIFQDFLTALQKYGTPEWYKWGSHAVFYSYSYPGEFKNWADVTKYYINVVGKNTPDVFGANTNIVNQQDYPIDVGGGNSKVKNETQVGNEKIVTDKTFFSEYSNTSGVNQTLTTPSYSAAYTEGTATMTSKSYGEATAVSVEIVYKPLPSIDTKFGFTQSFSYNETNTWTSHNSKTETFTSPPQNILVANGCKVKAVTTFSHADVEGTLLINKMIPAPYIWMNINGLKYSVYLPAALNIIKNYYPAKYNKLAIQRDGDSIESIRFQGEAMFKSDGGGHFSLTTDFYDITPASCGAIHSPGYVPIQSAIPLGAIKTDSNGISSRSYISIPEQKIVPTPSKITGTGVLPW